ncbi:hypothetical protein [Pseudoalteromonas piscicida]|uniref:hypothetical protein n=1 Tax=Pseudoalteromonas piscicida TaxID=43662 RepID=UPI0030B4231E
MNPIYADILDVVPLKLNSAFAHADPNQPETNAAMPVQLLTLPQTLKQDIVSAVGSMVEVVAGEQITLVDKRLSLPSTQLNSAQKRELWQVIWSQQYAN